ncbi:MAG: hypothetical protein H6754_04740 [Candidatus Omnitrophica bacterium]|nr:hypothetical protein [Candidatus Omnitrophota bacterium]
MSKLHTFHIPVMGTGFSIDSPVKVARYGISSVISLVDDTLIEDMRKFYCEQTGEPYTPITKYDEDFRAKRITAYLNLLDRIVKKQFADLKASAFVIGSEITKYFELLPETSPVKKLYREMLATGDEVCKKKMQDDLRNAIAPGDINVNIMTKLDRTNFAKDGVPLPSIYSDALAALRGYGESTLQSAIVFSAGINQRLYSYVEEFKDFYADASGFIKKRVILKVSDFRSSLIQGKFFAKKGIWISEYRVESGLNCGGHVFPAAGMLMGPILEEFKTKRGELISTLHTVYAEALKIKNRVIPAVVPEVKLTAQGGIGTLNEDRFLREYYNVDSTGWGTPFLLCPEATNVDEPTLRQLSQATEADLYTSDVSPLGVPFNNIRHNPSDDEKNRKIESGKPGSACPKGHLVSNVEFTKEPICTASRLYQKLKLEQLAKLQLAFTDYKKQFDAVVKKACICNDLGEGALIKNNVFKNGKRFSAVCPGPNLAYFSKIVTLKEMVDHIYGRINLLNSGYRPNMFNKELKINIDFLVREIKKILPSPTPKQIVYLNEFRTNLLGGIEYYQKLFPQMILETEEYRQKALQDLDALKVRLEEFVNVYSSVFKNHSQLVSV